MTENEKQTEGKALSLTEFLAEGRSLHSQKTIPLVITQGDKRITLAVEITTEGHRELVEQFKTQIPRPPIKTRQTRSGPVETPDPNDEKYQKAILTYLADMTVAIVGRAVVGEIKDRQGRSLIDSLERGRELVARGLTLHHLDQVEREVQEMVSLSEAERAFFSDKTSV